MKKIIIRGHWEDQKGFRWKAKIDKSSRYPNGRFNKIVLENGWGEKSWIRYNEIGQPIAGNLSLKFVKDKPHQSIDLFVA